MAKIIGAQPLYGYEDGTQVYVPGRRPLNIVVIGGGHGQSTALRGLKRYTPNLTGIVAVSDDGGGSGVLREDLGILPPGDIRNCIISLSNTEPLLEKLMSYRFETGTLQGQSFGNLFLAAMSEVCGSFDEAVQRMCELLSVTGRVLPVTNENIFLEAEFENGRTTLGESNIYLDKKLSGCRIREVRLCPAHPRALNASVLAILEADIVLIGPGSLYTSVIPNFLVDGIADAIRRSRAVKALVLNVMTQDGETEGYTASDHVKAILHHAGPNVVDVCVANSRPVPEESLAPYLAEGAEPLRLDREEIMALGVAVREFPLCSSGRYIRHNPDELAKAVLDVWKEFRIH